MTTISRNKQRALSDPLDQSSIGAIISGQLGAPPVWIVRAFLPGAESVAVVDLAPSPFPDEGRGRGPSESAEGQPGTQVASSQAGRTPATGRRRKTAAADGSPTPEGKSGQG